MAQTFDPILLRTFLAVATGLSFTRAAEQLGLSQPTVSQHVRRLEEAAGRQLINRDTRTVALTDNGEAMAGFARSILAVHDEAVAYFTGSAMRGRLRFGTADDLAITGLPRILREFRQVYPQINLELTVGQSDQLYKRLNAGQLDLVFVKWVAGAKDGTVVQHDAFAWVGLEQTALEPGDPVPLIVNRTPRPPGSIDGKRWSRSSRAGSGVVSNVGVPPDAGTRQSPLASSAVAKTIVPSSPQLPPRGNPSNEHIVVADSPVRGIRLISVRSKKATNRASAEKNGPRALVTPESGCASSRSSGRHSSELPLLDPPERYTR